MSAREEASRDVISCEVGGEVWTYKRGSTRIYGFGHQEINIWDHAAGKPGIPFTAEAIRERIEEWLADEAEADEEDPPRRRASTPPGMTDEEFSIERFGYNGEYA